jgi:processive 1,2-diacylglycerol beta-glucosyltransferase
MPRILLLHASVGIGHKRAAQALGNALQIHPTTTTIRIVDVLDYTSALFRMAYAKAWTELTDYAPELWGYFYTQTNTDPDVAKISNNIRKLVESVGTNDLKEVLHTFRPDIILCTHFLPMELLAQLKRKDHLTQPVYCVITDHAAHTFWTSTVIDGYFVGDSHTRKQLIERGIPGHKIRVRGIPINPSFAAPKDLSAIQRKRGVAPMHITLFGSGIADTHVRTIIKGIVSLDIPGSLAVVAGRNTSLMSSLANLYSHTAMTLRLMGFITYVDDIVAASTLVITKAGGLIVSEVLASGTPMVIVDPIPGHEEWNADFVVSNGAGMQLRMARSVPATVNRLLHTPPMLEMMQQRALAVASPDAAQHIANDVLDDWQGQSG